MFNIHKPQDPHVLEKLKNTHFIYAAILFLMGNFN